MKEIDLLKAHKHSINNKEEILNSKICACFYCQKQFSPTEITNWIMDNKPTAQCPYCLVDSVIGDASGIKFTKTFFKEMYKMWF